MLNRLAAYHSRHHWRCLSTTAAGARNRKSRHADHVHPFFCLAVPDQCSYYRSQYARHVVLGLLLFRLFFDGLLPLFIQFGPPKEKRLRLSPTLLEKLYAEGGEQFRVRALEAKLKLLSFKFVAGLLPAHPIGMETCWEFTDIR